MEKAIEFLERHEKFAVFTHINPDGDALGSAFSLASALTTYGKQAKVILLEPPPHKYDFEEFTPLYAMIDQINMAGFDACVAVDCADQKRLGSGQEAYFSKPTLNIDHHISNLNYADVNYVTDAAAAGEMIYDIIRLLGVPIYAVSQIALYMAIATDTGNFTFSNTTRKSLQICSELVNMGMDISFVANRVFNSRSFGATKLIQAYIEKIRLHLDERLSVSILTLEDIENAGAKLEDCENLINYGRDIDTVEIAVFVREIKQDVYKVSLRSKEYADVGDFAARFGGGGHKCAAGCMMRGNIHDIVQDIIKTAGEYIR